LKSKEVRRLLLRLSVYTRPEATTDSRTPKAEAKSIEPQRRFTSKRRVLKLSQALRQNAFKVAVSVKAKDGGVFVVSGFSTLSSTKEMAALLKKIDAKARKFVVALSVANMLKGRFVRNIAGVEIITFKNLNAYKVLLGGVLVIDKEAFGEEAKKETKSEVKEIKAEKKTIKKAEPKKAVKKTVKKAVRKGSK